MTHHHLGDLSKTSREARGIVRITVAQPDCPIPAGHFEQHPPDVDPPDIVRIHQSSSLHDADGDGPKGERPQVKVYLREEVMSEIL